MAVAPRVLNMKQFRVGMEKTAREWPDTIVKLWLKKIALEGLRGVVMRMPVDTGAHRANVQLSIGRASGRFDESKTTSAQEGDPPEAELLQTALAALSQLRPTDEVWITSPGPGTLSMEFGLYPPGPKTEGGFSKQAPRGMFRITAQEIVNSLKSRQLKVTESEVEVAL